MRKGLVQFWNNLRIGTRLTLGVSSILLLTLTVGLVGWITLESQAHSQQLANQAIDLVAALRAARQDEKNYVLRGGVIHVKETLNAIDRIRKNAEALKTDLSEDKRKTITALLAERDRYQNEFESYVKLNKKKGVNLNEMVTQGRQLENTAVILRDDQKKELQRLEALVITSSEQREEKREKADDANRIIKLMSEARQQEKNFLLRHDYRYADETRDLVDKLIAQARSTKDRFVDKENKTLAGQIIHSAEKYLEEFEKVIRGEKNRETALKSMIELGRAVENSSIKLREDQKQELVKLENLLTPVREQRFDKREKVDAANRIIKLMDETRQQEKNFLLRKEQSYADVTNSLVLRLIKEASSLRDHFQDEQNRLLANRIIGAANQYQKEFEKVVAITDKNTSSQDTMATLGRKVGDRSAQLREDQKQELQRLEKLSTISSKQRLDKRIKADTANRIIKLMGEARQQEKNFLLRQELAYAESTRLIVGKAVRQAELLRERFQDEQNRDLAGKIITAARAYLSEFEDVVRAVAEQQEQQEEMVSAARNIEGFAIDVREQTQRQADSSRETAVIIILTALALALVLGALAAIILTNSIAKPIRKLVDVIYRLAREDNVEVPLVENKDEIGQIARAISGFKKVILLRKEKTEAQLIQAEKMAALGDLMAGIAHEINTPIGIAVTGSTHLQDEISRLYKLFQEDALRKSEFRYFVENAMPTAATIQSNLERASSLIKSFKQVAVDQSSLETREFSLLPYIEEVLVSLQPKLKQTRHRVELQGEGKLTVKTVPGALSQIITNLVMNSLAHGYDSEDVAGTITIRVSHKINNAIIYYSDDGKGMNRDTASRIYEPFFTTSRRTGGSGLGLSIVFNLVTQTLGGSIKCQTEVGKGTIFEIIFPVDQKLEPGVVK